MKNGGGDTTAHRNVPAASSLFQMLILLSLSLRSPFRRSVVAIYYCVLLNITRHRSRPAHRKYRMIRVLRFCARLLSAIYTFLASAAIKWVIFVLIPINRFTFYSAVSKLLRLIESNISFILAPPLFFTFLFAQQRDSAYFGFLRDT